MAIGLHVPEFWSLTFSKVLGAWHPTLLHVQEKFHLSNIILSISLNHGRILQAIQAIYNLL